MVVDAVQQQPLMLLIGRQIRFIEQRAENSQSGLPIAFLAIGNPSLP